MFWRKAVSAGALLAWFAWFARPALFNGFNSDDPMNIHQYFRISWPEMVRHVVLFFEPSYRPVGGVLYKGTYDLFGFDPLPLHIAISAVMLVNVFLLRRFGELVTGSAAAGFLCAFAAAYHARMAPLYYLPSFLYDVLCFTFYVAALNVYLAPRMKSRPVSGRRLAAVVALYALALGSKEMAVSLPVAVLLYEALWHPPRSMRWRAALPALVLTAMTLVFLAGKSRGPDALQQIEGYRQTLTAAHVLDQQSKYLNEICYIDTARPFFTPVRAVLLWIALFALAALTRTRWLGWAAAMTMVAPLPLAVLTGRGGACLYIPLAFWAVIAAAGWLTTCRAAARVIANGARTLLSHVGQRGTLRPSGTRPEGDEEMEVSRLPVGRRLPVCPTRPGCTRRGQVACATLYAILAIAGAAAFGRMVIRQNRDVPRAMAEPARPGARIASEVRRVLPKPRPGARALYLTDVADGFDTKFITELVWGDRAADVQLQQHSRLPKEDFASMDYLLEFAPDGTLRILKDGAAAARGSGP